MTTDGITSPKARTDFNPARAFWFTGLPCSGKTTLATALQQKLRAHGMVTVLLDGDELRKGMNSDLGYEERDRSENLRRAAEASKLVVANGIVTLNCFITPTHALRQLVKNILGPAYVEVFVRCPLEVCERRDTKGMYRRARNGELKNFTGISAPFEEPTASDVTVDTSLLSVDDCVQQLLEVVSQETKRR